MNRFARPWLICLAFLFQACIPADARAQTNLHLRILSANLNGNSQTYEPFALRIFQGLKPDLVAIQEFNYGDNTPGAFRSMLDAAFGTNFAYYRETNPGYNIPNGIISRYPIVDAGSWPDAVVANRGFAWAQVRLPGSNDLYVVSVHLYSSGSAGDRNNEANAIKSYVQASFPPGAWVVVAGDLNTSTRTEAAVTTFKTFLSDSPIPTDAEAGGDPDTNSNRDKPYDYVLPSFSLAGFLTNAVFDSHSFSNGLVFDSRVYAPLSDVSPVLSTDSGNAQHMAVLKDFQLPCSATNSSGAGPLILGQPRSLTVLAGQEASFTADASGTAPLSYQWQFNGAPVSGGTLSTYTRKTAQLADAGKYAVVVWNSFGTNTSAEAFLTVNTNSPPAGILAQWTFNSAAADADSTTGTTLPVLGNGTAAPVGGTTGSFAGGSTNDTSTSTDNSGWNTTTYPALGLGNKTAGVSFAVSTAGRQNIVIRWDQRASNTGSKYVRLQYTTNGSTFLDFPSGVSVSTAGSFESKTNSLAGLPGVSDNPNFVFRMVAEFESTAINNANANYVAAAATSTYASSGTIRYDLVTVLGDPIAASNPPAIIADPSSQSASQGGSATFSVIASGSPTLTYQWRFNGAPIAGATATACTVTNVQPANAGLYSVLVTNSSGTALSAEAALTLIVPRPVLGWTNPRQIQWQGLSNLLYTVQACEDLGRNQWTNIGIAISSSTTLSFTNDPSFTQRFYRVRVEPPF